jgi:lysylphosphatidylglycerol synthetase-like protein (DUF2156 family)
MASFLQAMAKEHGFRVFGLAFVILIIVSGVPYFQERSPFKKFPQAYAAAMESMAALSPHKRAATRYAPSERPKVAFILCSVLLSSLALRACTWLPYL